MRSAGSTGGLRQGAGRRGPRNENQLLTDEDGEEEDEDEEDSDRSSTVFALVIDGKSLTFALEEALKPRLLALAMQCASVICCRVSPKQKALVSHAPLPCSPGFCALALQYASVFCCRVSLKQKALVCHATFPEPAFPLALPLTPSALHLGALG